MRTRIVGAMALALVAWGAAGVGSAPVAHAAVEPDQSQTSAIFAPGSGYSSTPALAQTFTAGLTGPLAQVDLGVIRTEVGSGSITVEIHDTVEGAPGPTVLASVAVPWESLGTDSDEWVSVDLTGDVTVVAGSTYAVVVDPGAITVGWWADIGDPYPGGASWRSTGAGAAGPWTASGTFDFTFRTYVGEDEQPAFRSSGFSAPVDMSTPARRVWNTVKGGRTVPLKFEVFDAATGSEVTDVAVVGSFTTTRVACDSGTANEDPVELVTTGGTSLRYDEASGQFVQSWRTPSTRGACYQVTVTLVDGSVIDQAFFEIK